MSAITPSERVEFVRALRSAARVPETLEGAIETNETGTVLGMLAAVRRVVHRDGAYRVDVDGPLPSATGFDGRRGWHRDSTGHVGPHEREELAVDRVLYDVLTNRWLTDDAEDYLTARPEVTDSGYVATFGLPGDRAAFQMAWNRNFQPTRLEMRAGHEHSWTFGPPSPSPWGLVPDAVTTRVGWLEDELRIERIEAAPSPDRSVPDSRTPGTSWTGPPDEVPIRRSPRGALPVVFPRLNDRELGGFLLDSGAGIVAITDRAADALGMSALGRTWVETSDGGAGACFRRGGVFTLGPLRIEDAVFLEVDAERLRATFGLPLAGILGYDVLARGGFVLSPERLRVGPQHDLSGASIRAAFEGRVPVLPCAVPGGNLELALDTGSSSSVVIYRAAQRRVGLSPGRPRVRGDGLTGALPFGRRRLPWLRVGPVELPRVEAMLALYETGAGGSPYRDGTVGYRALRGHRIGLDYPGRQVSIAALG